MSTYLSKRRLVGMLMVLQKESRYFRDAHVDLVDENARATWEFEKSRTGLEEALSVTETKLKWSNERRAALYKQVTELKRQVDRLSLREEEIATLQELYSDKVDECEVLRAQLTPEHSEDEKCHQRLVEKLNLQEDEIATLQELYGEKEGECEMLTDQLKREGQFVAELCEGSHNPPVPDNLASIRKIYGQLQHARESISAKIDGVYPSSRTLDELGLLIGQEMYDLRQTIVAIPGFLQDPHPSD
jgi:DNA repair exonuclease SbcCD ATPase subunit